MLPLLMVGHAHAANTTADEDEAFWQGKQDGWFWYRQPPIGPTEAPKPVDKPAIAAIAAPAKPPELLLHERLTKQAEELMKIAFINPTKENVEAYLRLQTRVVNQATRFSDQWQRVLWANPELDFANQDRPVNAAAITVFEREEAEKKRRTVAQLGRDHMLMFFFKGDCPYCHQFAPLLKRFEAAYGLRIFPVSLDGGGLPDFREPRTDNGIATRLNVSHVPALFLVNPATQQLQPIGVGILSEVELLTRLYTVATPAAPVNTTALSNDALPPSLISSSLSPRKGP
ncbi:MAG: conjugal transfer protein TraF [Betaproteobacteria bacterium]|nr:conjugal transfer protein TraF [Betaproteobacteria bacterium]